MKVNIQMTADDEIQMDPKRLMKLIETNLDAQIAQLN